MFRFSVRERRVFILVALLALSLVFTAILAYQAQDAARSHRATAERTLRDYASFAAIQFSIHAKEGIYSRATSLLFRPAPGWKRPWVDCASPAVDPDTVRFSFRIDLRSLALADTSGCATREVATWVRDTVAAHARSEFVRKWDYAYVIGAPDGRRWFIAYSVGYHDDGTPVKAYGFAAPFHGFARSVFKNVLDKFPLLPPSLVGTSPNDSLLSLVVDDGKRTTLFRSTSHYRSPFTGSYHAPNFFGGLSIEIALRESVADRLVIGGLPRSRLPMLLGLLGLTAAMLIVAIYYLRREYELARLRSDFISSISHELRTPLAQVRMFAETLLLGRVRSDQERHRSLQIIDQEARRLTHLVDNVLQFSRSERQAARIAPEPTALAPQVREAIEAFTPLAAARQVTIEAEIPDVVALVDPSALRQALLNLLDNAVKYGPSGQVVRVGVSAQGDRVRLWVDDQGPGIPERDRDNVWLPFTRLDRDANSAVAGSGIGLSVVRDLLVAHGGRAWVEDAPGGGARVILELSRCRDSEKRREPMSAVSRELSTGAAPSAGPTTDLTPTRT
jgi:signal transduction histidine kinase